MEVADDHFEHFVGVGAGFEGLVEGEGLEHADAAVDLGVGEHSVLCEDAAAGVECVGRCGAVGGERLEACEHFGMVVDVEVYIVVGGYAESLFGWHFKPVAKCYGYACEEVVDVG